MESVIPGYEDGDMEFLTTVVAVLAGVVTLVVGLFSLAALLFDDLP